MSKWPAPAWIQDNSHLAHITAYLTQRTPEQQVAGSNPARRTIDSEGFVFGGSFRKKYHFVPVTFSIGHLTNFRCRFPFCRSHGLSVNVQRGLDVGMA